MTRVALAIYSFVYLWSEIDPLVPYDYFGEFVFVSVCIGTLLVKDIISRMDELYPSDSEDDELELP